MFYNHRHHHYYQDDDNLIVELVHLQVVEGEPLVALILDHCCSNLTNKVIIMMT